MARILIVEPHRDIRFLLEVVVTRLGHVPVADPGEADETPDVDAAVIDPDEAASFALAARLHSEAVPVVFTSIFPPRPETLELEPVAYLLKPFPLYALEDALACAVGACPHPAVA